jgi:erythromycin esterase
LFYHWVSTFLFVEAIMRIPRLASTVLLLSLTLAPVAEAQSAVTPEAAHAPRPAGNPVLPGIWRLDGYDPALAAGDLEPLRQIVGKASVVGLGEAIHTSGGFYAMKDRVFRFLVEEMGFRAFAMESPWTDADRVSAYVQSCEGSPEDAIKGLFGVWQSTEVRDLVQWMCEWNRAHPKPKDRLQFFGFDIQQGERDKPALTAFLKRTGVAADSPWIAAIRACAGTYSILYPPLSEASYAQCTSGLEQIDSYFQRNARALARLTSKQDFEIAKLNLAGLRAWEDEIFYENRDSARASDVRDEAMAAAFGVLRSLRAPKAKTVIWAHNYHLAKGENDGGHPMGIFLARSLGRSYVNFALTAHDIAIDWPNIGCGPISRILDGSVEQRLRDLGAQALVVDLAFPGASSPYLPPGEYFLGDIRIDPRQLYNGILYLETSPKMTPTAWASCRR